MDADLLPGGYFEEFVEGAEAAWQSDEAIGQVGHTRFAFVHAADAI